MGALQYPDSALFELAYKLLDTDENMTSKRPKAVMQEVMKRKWWELKMGCKTLNTLQRKVVEADSALTKKMEDAYWHLPPTPGFLKLKKNVSYWLWEI